MRRIQSTKGYAMICDEEDFKRLSRFSWYAHCCSGNRKAKHYRPARRESLGKRKVHFAHHEIVGKPPEGKVVDHINGDPWDNRKCNLRFATVGQNCRNQRRNRKSNGAGKGIHIVDGRVHARIRAKGKKYHFCGFKSILEAELTYDALALHLHGEFACLNHPNKKTPPKSPEQVRAMLAERRPSALVLPFLRLGMSATEAAAEVGCSVTTAAIVAKKHGIELQRGRPITELST